MTLIVRVYQQLTIDTFTTPADIARAIGAPAPSVRAALQRLVARGRAVRDVRGIYRRAS